MYEQEVPPPRKPKHGKQTANKSTQIKSVKACSRFHDAQINFDPTLPNMVNNTKWPEPTAAVPVSKNWQGSVIHAVFATLTMACGKISLNPE